MGKKFKYEKSSAILIFLVYNVMIRFSALGAYLLLIPKGWRCFETGRYYGTRHLFNFLRTGKLFQTNLWRLFEKDQEDCWTDMLSLDLSWPERIAKKSSSQNSKARSFVRRNCTHIRITYNNIYMHAHLYEISTAAFKILWVSFEKVLKSGQDFTEAGRELKRLAAQPWNVPDSSGILRLIVRWKVTIYRVVQFQASDSRANVHHAGLCALL